MPDRTSYEVLVVIFLTIALHQFENHVSLNSLRDATATKKQFHHGEPMVLRAAGWLPREASDLDQSSASNIFVVDLATALRLGGAKSLQIQLARERTLQACLAWKQARAAVLPSLWYGVSWNRQVCGIRCR